MRSAFLRWLPAAAAATAMAVIGATSASGRSIRAHTTRSDGARAAATQACADPDNYPAQRDPSNPLDLPTPPGSNPLNGASFFVDGPAHGAAAGAIARILGENPTNFPDSYSWPQLRQSLQTG